MMKEREDNREEELNQDSPENETEERASDSDIQRLVQALEKKTNEASEANEKYLRTYADFDNYRKRMQRDLADFRKYANEQLAMELLTVVDNLGLALKHAGEANEVAKGLEQGVDLVYKQLLDVLEKFGVKRFSSEGEAFDPAKHAAMMQVVSADIPDNTVVQVLQEGYLYHDKVLRHAKVGVSKRPQPEAVAASKEE